MNRYIRMFLKYLDKEKFENILVCSQDFHEDAYRDLVDSFEQVEMTRAIGDKDLKAIKEVRENFVLKYMGFDCIKQHFGYCSVEMCLLNKISRGLMAYGGVKNTQNITDFME